MSRINIMRTQQVDWFINVAGINMFDLAARHSNISMHHRQKVSASSIHNFLGWLAYKNKHENREACIRPHRDDEVPIIFFDDVPKEIAMHIAKCYSACVIETSKEGGCHVWVHTDKSLSEHQRHLVQKHLHQRIRADSGSTSGEHWGRLCGYKNWKRSGCWVNLLAVTSNKALVVTDKMLVDVVVSKQLSPPVKQNRSVDSGSNVRHMLSGDASESAKEWGWTCERLAKGMNAAEVEAELYECAVARKKAGAQRYARLTVAKAIHHVGTSR